MVLKKAKFSCNTAVLSLSSLVKVITSLPTSYSILFIETTVTFQRPIIISRMVDNYEPNG